MNQRVNSGTAPNSLPRIDLRQTLQHLCGELMSSGGFQLVEICQWDEANDQAISLADASCAVDIANEGERFELADFPTTARVLATGEIAVIDTDMVDAETEWMIEYGLNSLLPAPLFEQDNIIGLIEIASADRTLLSNRALAPADLESLLLEWQYGKISRK